MTRIPQASCFRHASRTILACVAVLLAPGVQADAPHPPPICTHTGWVDDGDGCTGGAHPDFYWPRDCPKENHPALPGDAYRRLCRPPGEPPAPAFFCSPIGYNTYLCDGEPKVLDDSLQYTWTATGLTLSEPSYTDDTSVIEVSCVAPQGSGTGPHYLTLTVASSDGTTAAVTGPLTCSDAQSD